MRKFCLLYCIMILAGHAVVCQDETVKKVQYPEGFRESLDVVYTTVGEWEGRMDLYLPPIGGSPSPVVINIHGGGWNHGSKETQTGFSTFFKKGYAVANISYRLVQQGPAPAAIEDVRCALAYIIANAEALNIDRKKIVLMGGSAGGHLALMAGLLEDDRRFDKYCVKVDDIRVAAIIDKYGIADLTGEAVQKSKSVRNWLSTKAGDPAFVKSVSPLYYIKKTSPPVFIVHGDADPTVPYEQSVQLHKKLKKAGVNTRFITVAGGAHGKFPKEKNSEVNKAIIEFLKEVGVH